MLKAQDLQTRANGSKSKSWVLL